ncbi:MAG: redoxin domain-containing protein [Acidimicrobiia bacterium]|nr:redoxin domain-containing protein [Acidimicrobiia bacterium]
MSQLGQLNGEVRSLGARAVAIAVTATFSQQAFASALGVDFPLLSDWEGLVARAYGVQYDSWKGHRGVAKRSVFVIDPGGVVRYRWHTDDALVEPDFNDALAVLRALADR